MDDARGSGLKGTVVAAAVAGTLGGVPSTLHAVLTGRDPAEAIRAAGTLVDRDDAPSSRLLARGVAVHAAVSIGWAAVLVPALARRHAPVATGALLGVVIGVVDRAIAAGELPRLAALPLIPQIADHAVYGALVGAVVRHRNRRALDTR